MPTYKYGCKACGNVCLLKHKTDESPVECPVCNTNALNNLVRMPVPIAEMQKLLPAQTEERSMKERRKNLSSYIEEMRSDMKRERENR